MKNNKMMMCAVSLIAAALVGCGGSGDDSGSTPNLVDTIKPISKNALYLDATNSVVMVVDTDRTTNNLVVGDFGYSEIYFTNTLNAIDADSITMKGVTFASGSGYETLDNLNVTATFNADNVQLFGQYNGETLAYNMTKTADSLSLDEMEGTHTNYNDGSTWTINTDGSFYVNGICTITGSVERKGAYYQVVSATATGCSDSTFDGDYTDGVLISVEMNGAMQIAGMLGNDNALLWGSAPL